jgi:transposase InsO family protein
MREEGLRGKVRRRFARTTDSNHEEPVFENVLDRDFTATAPNQRWVGDITYLRTPNGFIYLAVVMDLFSRAIVGWALSAVIDRKLVIAALEDALRRRCPARGLLHHSDRGCQYASDDYQKLLDANGITCSMSRRGNCLDNAAMESWFGTLKTELGEDFESPAAAKRELFEYIEVFYNRKRMHSSLGYVSPAEFEGAAAMKAAA